MDPVHVTLIFSELNAMRVYSVLASSDDLSCPCWTSPFALLPHTGQRKQTLVDLKLGDLWGFCKIRAGENCIEVERVAFGEMKDSCVGSLAQLGQTGVPGGLSEALYQLRSK